VFYVERGDWQGHDSHHDDRKLRSWELKHDGLVCDCRACADEDDEKTFAYQSRSRRFRLRELDRETKYLRGKNLDKGVQEKDFAKKLLELAALHKAEGDFTTRLAYT
jgi:hypothetical protein